MGTFIFIAFVGWIADSEVDETGKLRCLCDSVLGPHIFKVSFLDPSSTWLPIIPQVNRSSRPIECYSTHLSSLSSPPLS